MTEPQKTRESLVDSAREAWAVQVKVLEWVVVPRESCQKPRLAHQRQVLFLMSLVSGSPAKGVMAFQKL